MHLILTSIKQKPINLILMAIVLCLYFLNNTVFKFCTRGIIQEFMICYFNDFICPLFFISYSNLLLITVNKEIKAYKSLLIFGFCAGVVCEFFAPIIKATATADFVDVVFYILGTSLYWYIINVIPGRRDAYDKT